MENASPSRTAPPVKRLSLVHRIGRAIKRFILRRGLRIPVRFEVILEMLKFGPWLRQQPKVVNLPNRFELYRWTNDWLKDAPVDYLEFGVWRGESIQEWARVNRHSDSRFFGFDSFEGLPEAWVKPTQVIPEGEYSAGGVVPACDDERMLFVKGLFQDTLPEFVDSFTPQNRLVLHFDADLYSSTLYALTMLHRFLVPGSLLVFDEFSSVHEFRALLDYVAAYRRRYELLATANWNYAQALIQIGE